MFRISNLVSRWSGSRKVSNLVTEIQGLSSIEACSSALLAVLTEYNVALAVQIKVKTRSALSMPLHRLLPTCSFLCLFLVIANPLSYNGTVNRGSAVDSIDKSSLLHEMLSSFSLFLRNDITSALYVRSTLLLHIIASIRARSKQIRHKSLSWTGVTGFPGILLENRQHIPPRRLRSFGKN